jgi:hypothetical protein
MFNLKKIVFKNPDSPGYWLVLGLLFKGIIPFIWLMHSKPICEIPGFWGGTGGDTSSYINPIDHWLATGLYLPDFRMPGYGIIYFIFRLLFSSALACNLMIILQYLLASVGVYLLALTAKNIFGGNRVFYLCFYIFLISNYSNFFDGFIQTESLCTSFLIFSVYFITKYLRSKSLIYLSNSAILLGWAVFMRPGFSLLLPCFALVIIFQKRVEIKINLKYGILFLLPFLLFDSMWTIRNYRKSKKIIPLTALTNYPNIEKGYLEPMFYFVQCWGGAYSFNDKAADIEWFEYTYPGRIKPAHIDSLSDNIYTSMYNKDSLLHLKGLILALQNPSIDSITANLYQSELMRKFTQYHEAFQRERPLVYYVLAPIKSTGIFLYGSFTKNYLNRGQTLGKLNVPLRIFANAFYLLILGFGLIGAIMLLFAGFKQNTLFLLAAIIPLYTIVIHAVVLRIPDNRFLMPAWPFIIICAAYIITKIADRFYPKA